MGQPPAICAKILAEMGVKHRKHILVGGDNLGMDMSFMPVSFSDLTTAVRSTSIRMRSMGNHMQSPPVDARSTPLSREDLEALFDLELIDGALEKSGLLDSEATEKEMMASIRGALYAED